MTELIPAPEPNLFLTAKEGTLLMRLFMRHRFAGKYGEGKSQRVFPSGQVSTIEEKIHAALKALKRVSPLWQEDEIDLFGKKEAYEEIELSDEDVKAGAEKKYDYLDKDMETGIVATPSVVKGIFWGCFQWMNPDSPPQVKMNLGLIDEIAWPILEKIDRASKMKDELGIKPENEIELPSDKDLALEKVTSEREKGEKADKKAKKETADSAV